MSDAMQAAGRTQKERLLVVIQQAEVPLCDDCLAAILRFPQRQAANRFARELVQAGAIARGEGACAKCGGMKLVNWRHGEIVAAAVVNRAAAVPTDERPWYWEGHVQEKIVAYLAVKGYQVKRTADTASREHGKDVVATSPDGRELWISVKGYPETSKNVQARHWLAGAVFDLLLYRDENPNVELAIGLPSGFVTYQGLVKRIQSAREQLPFRIYWVGEDGSVGEA